MSGFLISCARRRATFTPGLGVGQTRFRRCHQTPGVGHRSGNSAPRTTRVSARANGVDACPSAQFKGTLPVVEMVARRMTPGSPGTGFAASPKSCRPSTCSMRWSSQGPPAAPWAENAGRSGVGGSDFAVRPQHNDTCRQVVEDGLQIGARRIDLRHAVLHGPRASASCSVIEARRVSTHRVHRVRQWPVWEWGLQPPPG